MECLFCALRLWFTFCNLIYGVAFYDLCWIALLVAL